MMYLSAGDPADVFRLSRSVGPVTDDMSIDVIFSSKFRPLLVDKYVAGGASGSISFSKPYVANPVVVIYRTPFWDWEVQWASEGGYPATWHTRYEQSFRVDVYPTYLTWYGSFSSTFTFFVIGAVT